MKKIVLIISIFTFLSGCFIAANTTIPKVEDINGYTFVYTKDINVFVKFNQGMIYGNTGINQFMGEYKIQNNKLILYQVAITGMVGPDDKMIFESKFVKTLSSEPIIRLKNNHSIYIGKYHFEK